jgi:general secretion pathway protein A
MPPVKQAPQQTALNTLQWPVDLSPAQSKDMAYRALFRYWEIPYQGNVSPCRQAQAYGLDCVSGQGSLGSLIQLNRPAILKFYEGNGDEYYVTLTAVRGLHADFVVGGENRTVDIKEIEARWFGDYSLLRQTPLNYNGDVRPGARGPQVKRIEKQLAVVQGRKMRERKALTYDDALVRQVKEFQMSKGLTPDGIVGAKTISKLDTEVGSTGPRLNRGEVEK